VRYEDFIVQLGPETSEGIEVRASCSMAGEARGQLALSLSPEELASDFSAAVLGQEQAMGVATPRHLTPEIASPSSVQPARSAFDIGAALFDAVFRGPVRSLLDHSLGSLERNDDHGLRVKLKLELSDARLNRLHTLPWELLYKIDTGDFLALSRRTPIVRYLELPRTVRAVTQPGLLRVLALAPETPGQPALDLSSERRNLQALESELQNLKVDFLKSANLGALRRTLVNEKFHVLHLMGHGDFDPRTGQGVVYLERTDGGTEEVMAESLVAVVKDFPALRLVVLNACSTARAGGKEGSNPFAGLASALMRAGLPAVLAMQLPISDGAAVAFSEAFYAHLGAGYPLDAAVTEGRQAIHARTPSSMEWAVPALFLRAADGRIFTPEDDQASPEPKVKLSGLDYLRAGDFAGAIKDLRAEVTSEPNRGLLLVALGVALSRGRSLRRLPYQTAKEMHRLFASAVSTPDGRTLGAAALLALKLDYFEANSVREPTPTREDIFAMLDQAALSKEEGRLLSSLDLSEETTEIFGRFGLGERRGP